MRIAVVSNTAWYLYNFRLNLMLALQREGHRVVAIAPDDEYTARLRDAGVEVHSVLLSGRSINPLRELWSVRSLWSAFRRHRIQLVLSYTPKGNLYSALACRTAGILFVPNVSGLGRAFMKPSLLTRVVEALYRVTFGHAAKVYFQNEEDMALFVRRGFVKEGQCERLPGSGVDLSRFAPSPLVAREARAPVFLLVARMLWDKGVGEFVEAARQLKTEFSAARFRLLGFVDVSNPSAIAKSQIDQWCAEGLVEYLGATDDVRPFIADADCVVLPSTYREGVPRSLLEAAASGRPVITTDAPGCRDTVQEGVTGFLCRASDAGDLAQQMRRFAALSPAQRANMGRSARARVEASFDERLVIGSYLSFAGRLSKSHRRFSPTLAPAVLHPELPTRPPGRQ